MRHLLLFCLALLVFPGVVMAGSIEHKTEISIFSGWSFPGIDETNNRCFPCLPSPLVPAFSVLLTQSLNSSAIVGFGVSRYLNDNMAVEGSFSVSPNHELTQTSSIDCPPGEICPLIFFPDFYLHHNVVAYSYGGNFVYHFTTGQVRPYVTAGVGGISFDIESNTRTDVAWTFGAGAKFLLGKRTGLRFEVNDHLIPNHFVTAKTENNLQIQYGFVFGL
jgi:outer membrane protein W